jgi:hypothetical protein
MTGEPIDERGWIDTGGVRGGLHGDDPETGLVLYFDVPGRYTSCRDDQGVAFGLRRPPG